MNPIKWIFTIIGLLIIALIIALVCGVPALDWLAWGVEFIAGIFDWLADLCRWLQKAINWIR